ncbi:MAG: hypothetical protein H0V48_10125 [Nocardioidaceae bacterium]|nr:hypothetical protein [Nocardioidaceae bacterium]
MYLTAADQLGGLQQAVPEIALGIAGAVAGPWRDPAQVAEAEWSSQRRPPPAAAASTVSCGVTPKLNRLGRCRSAALGVRGLLEVGFEDAAE